MHMVKREKRAMAHPEGEGLLDLPELPDVHRVDTPGVPHDPIERAERTQALSAHHEHAARRCVAAAAGHCVFAR